MVFWQKLQCSKQTNIIENKKHVLTRKRTEKRRKHLLAVSGSSQIIFSQISIAGDTQFIFI